MLTCSRSRLFSQDSFTLLHWSPLIFAFCFRVYRIKIKNSIKIMNRPTEDFTIERLFDQNFKISTLYLIWNQYRKLECKNQIIENTTTPAKKYEAFLHTLLIGLLILLPSSSLEGVRLAWSMCLWSLSVSLYNSDPGWHWERNGYKKSESDHDNSSTLSHWILNEESLKIFLGVTRCQPRFELKCFSFWKIYRYSEESRPNHNKINRWTNSIIQKDF